MFFLNWLSCCEQNEVHIVWTFGPPKKQVQFLDCSSRQMTSSFLKLSSERFFGSCSGHWHGCDIGYCLQKNNNKKTSFIFYSTSSGSQIRNEKKNIQKCVTCVILRMYLTVNFYFVSDIWKMRKLLIKLKNRTFSNTIWGSEFIHKKRVNNQSSDKKF